jgi:hypothetical protein
MVVRVSSYFMSPEKMVSMQCFAWRTTSERAQYRRIMGSACKGRAGCGGSAPTAAAGWRSDLHLSVVRSGAPVDREGTLPLLRHAAKVPGVVWKPQSVRGP